MSFNLATILRESRTAHPDKALCHVGQQTLTYQQVDEMSGRVASSLLSLGLVPGDAVAVQLPNLPQFLFTYFAILKAGLVMVPLNPLLKGPEVAYHLHDSRSKVLVTFGPFAAEAVRGLAGLDDDVLTYVVDSPGVEARPEGTRSYDELYLGEDTGDIAAMAADDTAVLLYTSGTTGKPKGAELTHFQLYMNCTVAGELFHFRDDDVSLAVLPLFHVFGLSSVVNVAIRYGGTIVLVPRFEVPAVLEAVSTRRCTLFSGVPTMYVALLQHDTTAYDLTSLRIGISGGAAIPGEVIRAFEEKFPHVVVLEGYGLSETASTATFNIDADHRKVLSIGKPIWGVQVRVVDEHGAPLPPGQGNVGELVIRGHNVMKGYFGNPQATADAFRDGWFRTGDLGHQDSDGYFFVVDRTKDLVIRGGYNVYPREIEETLYEHPAVAEAAVVGRPHSSLGEEVLAYVTLRAGATVTPDEIVAWARERLAAYKYPREVRILDELPKGPTGKVLKRELRDRAEATGAVLAGSQQATA